MFGTVPAATSTVRAGSSIFDPSARVKIMALTCPNSSGTASTGFMFSVTEMPSSSALATSS